MALKELISLLAKAEAMGIKFSTKDGELVYRVKEKAAISEHHLEEFKAHKDEIIAFITSNNSRGALQSIPVENKSSGISPLSFSQERLWFIDKLQGSVEYNLYSALQIDGYLDTDALKGSLKEVVSRHEILRTVFREADDQPWQHIRPIDDTCFIFEKRSIPSPGSIQNEVKQLISLPFDLSMGPLLRLYVLQVNDVQNVLVFVMHHIVSDGWSERIFFDELAQFYRQICSGKSVSMPGLPIQYADYCRWQRSDQIARELDKQLKYWIGKLTDAQPLNLPVDFKRPSIQSTRGRVSKRSIDSALTKKIRIFSKEEGATSFMFFLTALNILLSRYTGQRDVCVGTPIAGRDHNDTAGLIGLFVNTLVIRCNLDKDDEGRAPTFRKLLKEVKTLTLDAYANQYVPFERIVDKVVTNRDMSTTPLFQVFFSIRNEDETELFLDKDLTVKPVDIVNDWSKFDLAFHVNESSQQLYISLEYCIDLFAETTVNRMLDNFIELMRSATDHPDMEVLTLPMIAASQVQQQLQEFNNTNRFFDTTETVIDLFENQVTRRKDCIAVHFGDEALTFEELNSRSNRLANYLKQSGVTKNTYIGICIERSVEMVVSLLAVMKAGAAYVPLDPAYPQSRLSSIVEDCNISHLITNDRVLSFFDVSTVGHVVNWDRCEWLAYPSSNPGVTLNPADAVYAIYTSGSTGTPKGVRVTHGNVRSFFSALEDYFGGAQKQVWLSVTSISFDISFLELFWPLCNGNELVVSPDIGMPSAGEKELDFGLFYFAAHDAEGAIDKYELLLQGARFADKNDLSAVWIPERHFHSFGDQFPNPSVAAAAVAVATQKVKIRSGSVVLPLHDVVRVAEEWSMVDHFSNGRIEMSFASGWHPNDFVLAPDDYADRFQKMQDKLTLLLEVWRGKPLNRVNGAGKNVNVSIHPRPLQRILPIWITAAGSVKTFEYAGSIGANLLTHLLGQSDEDLKQKIEIYRRALADNGFDPASRKVAVMLHTYISDNYEKVKETVREPFKNYLRHSIDLVKPLAEEAGFDIDKDLELLVEFGFNRFFNTRGLFGTVDDCFTYSQRLAKLGVNEVACLIDFGVDNKLVLQQLPFIAELKQKMARAYAQHNFLSRRLSKNVSIASLIAKHQVTHFQCTPTFAQELVNDEDQLAAISLLNTMLVGGEALTEHLASELTQTGVNLYNMYGPTEATIWATSSRINRSGKVTIGKPLSNSSVYILDESLSPVPIGVIGKLYIGGAGVAQGYVNRPELSAAKFIVNPLQKHERLYDSGDLARWTENGEIEFLGRADDQVKIRGHRIELTEIESTALQFPGVLQCAVVVRENASRHAHLEAFVVCKETIETEKIIEFLRLRLPSYMVPLFVSQLGDLPRTPNGKVNKKALPHDKGAAGKSNYVGPRNSVEVQICNLWQELLQVDHVGVYDNFFEIGGDSIITIQVVSRLKKIGYSILPRDIFAHQTVATLANAISREAGRLTFAEQGTLTGNALLLPIQRWFFETQPGGLSHYNQSIILNVPKHFDYATFVRIIQSIVAHHDALRFKYELLPEGGWAQSYGELEPEVHNIDLTRVDNDVLKNEITRACSSLQRTLDIRRGKMVVAGFIVTPSSEGFNRLFIAIHHLAIDGVSWRIILNDLQQSLDPASTGGTINRGHKTTSYRQWGALLSEFAKSEEVLSQLQYWKNVCSTYRPLPCDIDSSPVTYESAEIHTVSLSRVLTKKLLSRANRAYHTEINDLLLTALVRAFSDIMKGAPLLVGLEGHGREYFTDDVDLSHSVGWFTTLFPVALSLEGAGQVGESIKSVKEQLRRIPARGIGYGLLAYDLNNSRGDSVLPNNWDVSFNYLGQFDNSISSDSRITGALEPVGEAFSRETILKEKIGIVASVTSGELTFFWTYSTNQFYSKTIEQLAVRMIDELTYIIDHCDSRQYPGYTPSDFGIAPDVSWNELDGFLDTADGDAFNRDRVSFISRLSPLQEGILFHTLDDQGAHAYTQQFQFTLDKGFNLNAFLKAMDHLVQAHSILRTGFLHTHFSVPVQCVYNKAVVPFKQIDFASLDLESGLEAYEQYLKQDMSAGFDMAKPPLIRISVIKLGDGTYRLVWTYNHILIDGWSLAILLQELAAAYAAVADGRMLTPIPTDNYHEFIIQLGRRNKYKDRQFWREYLHRVSDSILLPFIDSRYDSAENPADPRIIDLKFDAAFSFKVKSLAQMARVTVNTIVQAVWSLLLARYTSRPDVIFGITLSGRSADLADSEKRVGLFMNTVPLTVTIQPDQSVIDWFLILQESYQQMQGHDHVGLAEIFSCVGASQPLFDSILVFENYPTQNMSSNFTVQSIPIRSMAMQELTNYPLTIDASFGTELAIKFNYYENLLSTEYVQNISAHFNAVIRCMVESPQLKLSQIKIPVENERLLLEIGFNQTAKDYPRDKTISQLFEEQVSIFRDCIAVVDEEEAITYQSLDSRANVLAVELIRAGVNRNDVVGIVLERSINLAVSIFGVWKAGAAFLLVERELPVDRAVFMLKESGSKVSVTDSLWDVRLRNSGFTAIDVSIANDVTTVPDFKPPYASSTDLAFVIFTSGSTGIPKGILIEHKSKINHLYALIRNLRIDDSSVIAQTASTSFDIFLWQMITALLVGGRTVIYSKELQLQLHDFTMRVKTDHVTHLEHVPSFYSPWFDFLVENKITFQHLKYLVTCGEEIRTREVAKWFSLGMDVPIVNAYGPAEASDDVSLYFMNRVPDVKTIPVGKPVQNVLMYVVDSQLELCPMGVPGEIAIGGECLARGYVRPEFTSQKFIRSPFSQGGLLYLTGDIGKVLPDGNIVFVGRNDTQVKIRGRRIELTEIENFLISTGMVEACVVVAREDTLNEKTLVAYIVTRAAFNKSSLLGMLRSKLPDFMVPSAVVELLKLPLTLNGKVDKAALPPPSYNESDEFVPLESKLQEKLAQVWWDILKRNEATPGMNSNFFALGANSLHVIRLVAAIRRQFNVDVQIRQIFNNPTIGSLAAVIEATATTAKTPVIERTPRQGFIPMSYSQERLWFIDKLTSGTNYNMFVLLRLKGVVDLPALVYALRTIVERHEVLRTRLLTDAQGNGYQEIVSTIPKTDIVSHTSGMNESELLRYVKLQISKPIDLEKRHLLTSQLIAVSPHDHLLIVLVHHVAFDGFSEGIFLNELTELYTAKIEQRKPVLPALPIQYADYAVWQRQELAGTTFQRKLNYWKNKFSGFSPLELPTDFMRPPVLSTTGLVVSRVIDDELRRKMTDIARKEDVTTFTLMLAVFKVLMYRYTGQADICIGTSIANRSIPETENLIGFFVNTLPLRTNIAELPDGENSTFRLFLHAVMKTLLEVYDHQDVPFEKIVEVVDKSRTVSRSPIFDVMFVSQEMPTAVISSIPDLLIEQFPIDSGVAKFDLVFGVEEIEGNMTIGIEYCVALFANSTIQKMLDDFCDLMRIIVEEPARPLSTLKGSAHLVINDQINNSIRIRGYRVELDKVSTIIQSHDLVDSAIVLCDQSTVNKPQLVAYVKTTHSAAIDVIRDDMKNHLPDYMLPERWIEVDEQFINSAGDIDLTNLPLCDNRSVDGSLLMPRNRIERDLLEIWKKLLHTEAIGMLDNFFEKGGDSIVSVQMAGAARRKGYQISPSDIFKHQTIASLASIATDKKRRILEGEQGKLTGESGLLPVQHMFFEKKTEYRSHFNQSVLLDIDKTITVKDLHAAINILVDHHDALRFKYRYDNGAWHQSYGDNTVELAVADTFAIANMNEFLTGLQRSLDIETGILVRAVLMQTPPDEPHKVLLIIHHLAIDSVSWRVLLEQLETVLSSILNGNKPDLGPKGTSYREWFSIVEKLADDPEVFSKLKYWQQVAMDYQPISSISNALSQSVYRDMKVHSVQLDPMLTSSLLEEANQAYHTEPKDLLVAALVKTLCNSLGLNKVVLAFKEHGHHDDQGDVDTTGTVGWFTTFNPGSFEFVDEAWPGELLTSVKEYFRATAGDGLRFGALAYLHPDRTVRETMSMVKWDIVFNYIGQLDGILASSSLIKPSMGERGEEVSGDFPVDTPLEIGAFILDSRLNVELSYSEKLFDRDAITSLASAYVKNLQDLIDYCLAKEFGEFTASDLSVKALEGEDIIKF